MIIKSLNAELNPICHLLALLGAHHILHVSRIRVKKQSFFILYKQLFTFNKYSLHTGDKFDPRSVLVSQKRQSHKRFTFLVKLASFSHIDRPQISDAIQEEKRFTYLKTPYTPN